MRRGGPNRRKIALVHKLKTTCSYSWQCIELQSGPRCSKRLHRPPSTNQAKFDRFESSANQDPIIEVENLKAQVKDGKQDQRYLRPLGKRNNASVCPPSCLDSCHCEMGTLFFASMLLLNTCIPVLAVIPVGVEKAMRVSRRHELPLPGTQKSRYGRFRFATLLSRTVRAD